MGQCCNRQNKNIITPVDDTDDIPMNSSIAIGQYHLMISYSLSDRSRCHRLATNLIKDGFRVWFESNPIDNEFEFNRIIHKVIDNSDCVILCISNSYSQTYRCQKEVRYASDMKKRIIMIKVEDDYVMNDWLSFIEPGKIQFQLCNNDLDFKNNYQQILKELVIDNSDCIILCVSDSYSQTYRCQKEARYASDMKKNIIMVKVTDGYRMNDWLSFIKPGKIQFQLSKNKINFKTTYQKIRQELERITKLHSFYSYRALEASSTESTSPTTQKYRLQSSEILFYKLIDRPWCFNTAIAEGSYAWTTIDSFIGLAIRTDEEMKRRYELDFDLSLMIKRRQQLSSYFNADSLDYFCKFAQRMKQNIIDWQKFCEK
ncbi:unnamed protein product [Adineta steineri]|nr:unnamed protein product [Adineta steineri]